MSMSAQRVLVLMMATALIHPEVIIANVQGYFMGNIASHVSKVPF